jgi:tRNA A-37 threonylcarbamoyl transferase component Bud32
MEEIPRAISLNDRIGADPKPARALIESVADLIGRLHREGFSHRDLKATNVVFDAQDQPYLIDLDGLSYVGEISEARAAADLQRLARGVEQSGKVTRRERIHFLRTYCRTRNLKEIPRSGA